MSAKRVIREYSTQFSNFSFSIKNKFVDFPLGQHGRWGHASCMNECYVVYFLMCSSGRQSRTCSEGNYLIYANRHLDTLLRLKFIVTDNHCAQHKQLFTETISDWQITISLLGFLPSLHRIYWMPDIRGCTAVFGRDALWKRQKLFNHHDIYFHAANRNVNVTMLCKIRWSLWILK